MTSRRLSHTLLLLGWSLCSCAASPLRSISRSSVTSSNTPQTAALSQRQLEDEDFDLSRGQAVTLAPILLQLYETSSEPLSFDAVRALEFAMNDFLLDALFFQESLQGIRSEVRLQRAVLQQTTETPGTETVLQVGLQFDDAATLPSLGTLQQDVDLAFATDESLQRFVDDYLVPTARGIQDWELVQSAVYVSASDRVTTSPTASPTESEAFTGNTGDNSNVDRGNSGGSTNFAAANTQVQAQPKDPAWKALYPAAIAFVSMFVLTAIILGARRQRVIDVNDLASQDDDDDDDDSQIEPDFPPQQIEIAQEIPLHSLRMDDGQTFVHLPSQKSSPGVTRITSASSTYSGSSSAGLDDSIVLRNYPQRALLHPRGYDEEEMEVPKPQGAGD